jgi:hypothetical protein
LLLDAPVEPLVLLVELPVACQHLEEPGELRDERADPLQEPGAEQQQLAGAGLHGALLEIGVTRLRDEHDGQVPEALTQPVQELQTGGVTLSGIGVDHEERSLALLPRALQQRIERPHSLDACIRPQRGRKGPHEIVGVSARFGLEQNHLAQHHQTYRTIW